VIDDHALVSRGVTFTVGEGARGDRNKRRSLLISFFAMLG
jgi:hypothetical protein